jgi:cation diffusion facilitator family transporter
MVSSRSRAAKLALVVIIGLAVAKVVVGIVTGSISVIAQAADSFLDLFAVVVTFLAVVAASRPPDEEHPFGHGKVEYVAAVVQGLLIFTAGGLIIYSSTRRIIAGEVLEVAEAGIAVMLLSIIASIFLARYLRHVAQATDSMALEANAHNIAADVYSAAGVLVGLTVIRFTGLVVIDPIMAILVSLVMFRSGYSVLRKAYRGLTDVRLPEEELAVVRSAIKEHIGELVDFHALRTRKSGGQRYIDLHLVMPRHISLEEAHRMCDHLEQDIKSKLARASMTIHVEPCSEECEKCPVLPAQRRNKG